MTTDTPTDSALRVAEPVHKHDPLEAFRHAPYRLLLGGKLIGVLGLQMTGNAIGWQLYELTRAPLALGLIGLVQIVPVLLLALNAGHIVDRYNRKRILITAQASLAALALALISISIGPVLDRVRCVNEICDPVPTELILPLVLTYICLLGLGIANVFWSPASSTMLPQTVPANILSNAITWSSNSWQLAAIIGPAISGAIIGSTKSATPVYMVNAVLAGVAALMFVGLPYRPPERAPERLTRRSLLAGLHYMRRTPEILGAITLDMFAVLLGGATALMPVFAKDILFVGPEGLGWLRAAPSVGAIGMSILIARLPPFRQAGRTLLIAVAGFGVATIIFGLSTSFLLSLSMLFLLGALDMVSVVIRQSLVVIRTPDELRGRLSAVNSLFIGMSNEMGAFESGVAAALIGPVGAVVFGGVGTIVTVFGVMWAFPALRRMTTLDGTRHG